MRCTARCVGVVSGGGFYAVFDAVDDGAADGAGVRDEVAHRGDVAFLEELADDRGHARLA